MTILLAISQARKVFQEPSCTTGSQDAAIKYVSDHENDVAGLPVLT